MLVVGAGITGALVAEAATFVGLSTIVIDRRPPAHGSTAASTALLQFEIDTPLSHLADQLGLERASRAWLRSYRAVQDLGQLVYRLSINCGFRPRRALYLSGNVLDPVALAEECRMRQSIGLPSQWLEGDKLRGNFRINHGTAILSDGAAEVDPVQLTAGILREAVGRGCRLCAPTELAEMSASTRRVEAVTTDGFEIEAGALVYATGYELAEGVPTKGHQLSSTWAFATSPQPERIWGGGELIWEAADPYLYIRTTLDGRVIVGGEDAGIADDKVRDALMPEKILRLQDKTQALLPGIDVTAEYAWAGTFGASNTGLPSIGAIPGFPNCFAVLGFGGNGITFGMMAAQIIANALREARDPDEELFAFRS